MSSSGGASARFTGLSPSGRLRREAHVLGLLFASTTSMIGSGWLFGASWLLPWFGGLWLLSGLSDIGGGIGVLGFWFGVLLVTVWSLVVLALAMRAALNPQGTVAIMARMEDAA